MPLEKPPFTPQRLEEDRAKDRSWTMTLRYNEQERVMIDRLRVLLNISSERKALKKGAEIGLNVLQMLFSEEMLKYLTDGKRERLTDYRRGQQAKIVGNVSQKGEDL